MTITSPSLTRRTVISLAGIGLGATLARGDTAIARQAMGTPTPPNTPTPPASPAPGMSEPRIRFTVDGPAGDTEIVVLLADNPTSRDFLTMLPLDLAFEEFAGNEKISYLPRELVTEGSPGTTPAPGDLIYFVPWGNLGFFYDDPTSPAYDERVIPIGKVERGFDHLADLETGPVHAELPSSTATPGATPQG